MIVTPKTKATISDAWRRGPSWLVRDLSFRDYDCALRFANFIGKINDRGHHAEICVMHGAGGRLRLTVRNLNGAGLTEQEFRLASRLDAAISEHYDRAYEAEPAPPPAIDGQHTEEASALEAALA